MHIFKFLLPALTALTVSSPTLAATPLIEVKQLGHGVSEVSYRHSQPTCLGEDIQIGIERFEVRHSWQGALFPGQFNVDIGDNGRLNQCHAPGPEQESIIRFLIETHRLGHGAQLLGLQRASKYKLRINGVTLGVIETGLLGDHEIQLLPDLPER